ncbi:MAG: hypothetical protein H7175_11745, partial [Burkholderiales bacterium]|nr:hypothetical protein [Anaerolineae bacterium]
TPEDEFVLDFGVAPDGNWLAYRTQEALFITDLHSGYSTTLDTDADFPATRGEGDTVAWSPQGDAVAYTTLGGARVYFLSSPGVNIVTFIIELHEGPFSNLSWSPSGRYLAAEAADNVWWVYRRDGAALNLASAIPSALGATWLNGNELIFAPAEGGIARMNLDSQNAQTAIVNDTRLYYLPYYLPDGTLLAFTQPEIAADPAPDNDSTPVAPLLDPEGYGVLLRLPAGASQPETFGQAPILLTDAQWSPDGGLLSALRDGVFALVNPQTGSAFPLPIQDAVAYAWAPRPLQAVDGLPLTADGYFLAQDENGESNAGIAQVWHLPADGSPVEQLTSAEQNVTGYGVSRDGRLLTYSSERKLWLLDLSAPIPPTAIPATATPIPPTATATPPASIATPDATLAATLAAAQPTAPAINPVATVLSRSVARELTSLSGDLDAQPVFSPDNTRIAYTNGGIWVVSATGGDARSIVNNTPTITYSQPRFSPIDANLLLIDIAEGSGHTPGLLDLTAVQIAEIPNRHADAGWLRDGRIFSYGPGFGELSGGLHITTAEMPAQPAPLLAANVGIANAVEAAPGRLRMLLPTREIGPSPLRVMETSASNSINSVTEGGFVVAPLLSPDGNFIAGYTYTEVDATASGIRRGPLTLRDLTSGQQVILRAPQQIWDFQWGSG